MVIYCVFYRFGFRFAAGSRLSKEEAEASAGASAGLQTLCCHGLIMSWNSKLSLNTFFLFRILLTHCAVLIFHILPPEKRFENY